MWVLGFDRAGGVNALHVREKASNERESAPVPRSDGTTVTTMATARRTIRMINFGSLDYLGAGRG